MDCHLGLAVAWNKAALQRCKAVSLVAVNDKPLVISTHRKLISIHFFLHLSSSCNNQNCYPTPPLFIFSSSRLERKHEIQFTLEKRGVGGGELSAITVATC